MRILHEMYHNSIVEDSVEIIGLCDWTIDDFIKKSEEKNHYVNDDGEIECDTENDDEYVEVWRILG